MTRSRTWTLVFSTLLALMAAATGCSNPAAPAATGGATSAAPQATAAPQPAMPSPAAAPPAPTAVPSSAAPTTAPAARPAVVIKPLIVPSDVGSKSAYSSVTLHERGTSWYFIDDNSPYFSALDAGSPEEAIRHVSTGVDLSAGYRKVDRATKIGDAYTVWSNEKAGELTLMAAVGKLVVRMRSASGLTVDQIEKWIKLMAERAAGNPFMPAPATMADLAGTLGADKNRAKPLLTRDDLGKGWEISSMRLQSREFEMTFKPVDGQASPPGLSSVVNKVIYHPNANEASGYVNFNFDNVRTLPAPKLEGQLINTSKATYGDKGEVNFVVAADGISYLVTVHPRDTSADRTASLDLAGRLMKVMLGRKAQ